MNDVETRHLTVHAISIRSLAMIGFVFGLLSGGLTIAIISYTVSSASFVPDTIHFDSGLVTMTRPYPVSAMLFVGWPLIAAVLNAFALAAIGLVYNLVASRAPLTFQISTRSE